MMLKTGVVVVLMMAGPGALYAQTIPCPEAKNLPQLTIRGMEESAVPVVDNWQVFLDDVVLSDAQVAEFSGVDHYIDLTRREMSVRGKRVFWSLVASALGVASSSTGWVLFGQNELPRATTLSIAVGGVLVGVAGVLFAMETVNDSLEAHLAPTPVHRISRPEMRGLVAKVNHGIYRRICAASEQIRALHQPGAFQLVPALKPPQVLAAD
jgi:hypothetical protein